MMKAINPAGVPASPAYSQGMLASAFQQVLFVSGQVGARADGTVGNGVAEQALIAIGNLNAVLAEAGMDASNIAKMTIYLTDESLLGDFMAGAGGSLPSPPPAITLLIVKALAAPNLLVEIEAIAVR